MSLLGALSALVVYAIVPRTRKFIHNKKKDIVLNTNKIKKLEFFVGFAKKQTPEKKLFITVWKLLKPTTRDDYGRSIIDSTFGHLNEMICKKEENGILTFCSKDLLPLLQSANVQQYLVSLECKSTTNNKLSEIKQVTLQPITQSQGQLKVLSSKGNAYPLVEGSDQVPLDACINSGFHVSLKVTLENNYEEVVHL